MNNILSVNLVRLGRFSSYRKYPKLIATASLLVFIFSNQYVLASPSTIEQESKSTIEVKGSITATNGGIVANGPVTIGISLQEHEASLQRREKEIEEKYQKAIKEKDRQSDSQNRKIGGLEAELKGVRQQLVNPKESYEKLAQLVKDQSIELEKLRGHFSDHDLIEARKTLEKGDTSKAAELFKKIRDESEAPIKQAAEASYQLGRIAENNIHYNEAYVNYQRATQLDPSNASYNRSFGSLAWMLGLYNEAIPHQVQALKIDRAALGENHPNVATDLNNIGLTWNDKGNYDKAIDYYEQALKIHRTILGENHPYVATELNNIGGVWNSKGNYDKAIDYYEQALKIDRAALSENHPYVATSLNNIGLAWSNKGSYDKSIEYYEQALKILRAALGENHPNTATNLNNIGTTWYRKGNYDKAIKYYEQALETHRAVLGENHPNVATDLSNIGLALRSQGSYDKAIEYYKKALDILENHLGKDHPITQTVRSNLEAVYQKTKK